jgi:hypothetical protein
LFSKKGEIEMIKKMYQRPEITKIEICEDANIITASAMGEKGEDDWGNNDNSSDRNEFFQ